MDIENRHVLNVEEQDDAIIVKFAKHEDMEEANNEDILDIESSGYGKDDEERDEKQNIVYRTIDLSRASYIDEEKRRVRIGVSSEEPVERDFGMEILSHSEGDVDMAFMSSGRAPLLLDHDMRQQIGVIEQYKLDQSTKRAVAIVRFGRSALADEVFRDVLDGIRQNISVGYVVNKMERTSESIDGKPAYIVGHSPMEVSIVSVPADQSNAVGVGRSKDQQNKTQESEMTEEVKQETKPEVNVEEVRSQAVAAAKQEFQRNSKEIYDIATKHNRRDLADKAIQEGVSVDEFRGVMLDNIADNAPLETPEIGMTKKEVRKFSLMRAINALANPTDRRAQQDAEFEFACSEEAAKLYGRTAQGIMLPPEVMNQWGQRDLNASDDSDLIAEDYRGGDFIDVLRNKSAVMDSATMLRGLTGDVKIPKKTAASTAAFISSEGGDAGESEMTIGNVSLTPKTLGAFTEVTRQLLTQSSLDVENLIRDDLAASMAIAIDNAALEGSGSSGNPKGITNTTGINTVSLSSAAAPTFAEMVSVETAVAVDNALVGDLMYIMHPTNYGTLKTTEKATNTAQFVAVGNQVNGYNTNVSAQLTVNNYVFGNMRDLLIGMFGGLDIVVDPFSNSKSGTVRVVALQSVDTAVRHAVSFCVAS